MNRNMYSASSTTVTTSTTVMEHLRVPGSGAVPGVDDYTASIELSNACREFYRNRVQATEDFKQTLGSGACKPKDVKKKTSIDNAMDTLRNEMASLMDQDLSLMKQLLTLNEAIEDLKVKRLYHVSKDSLRASSQDMHVSDWSVSETDMYETDEESIQKQTGRQVHETVLPSTRPACSSANTNTASPSTKKRNCDITILMNGVPMKVCHGQQSSVDSGYGDESFPRIYTGPMEVTL